MNYDIYDNILQLKTNVDIDKQCVVVDYNNTVDDGFNFR